MEFDREKNMQNSIATKLIKKNKPFETHCSNNKFKNRIMYFLGQVECK